MTSVVSSQVVTESSGKMRNGRIVSWHFWQVWICLLECGHKVKRRKEGVEAPTRLKCGKCC